MNIQKGAHPECAHAFSSSSTYHTLPLDGAKNNSGWCQKQDREIAKGGGWAADWNENE